MIRKRRISLCREGQYYLLVLLAVLLGATARQLNLLMLLGAMLAGPLLFSLIYGRLALARLAVLRLLPGQLRADQPLAVDVSLTNGWRWLGLWSLEVEDRVVRQRGGDAIGTPTDVTVYYPRVAGRQTKHASYRGSLPERGQYVFGPLRVSTRFPLGLIRHTLTIDHPETLLVHPRIGRLTREWGQLVREHATGAQRLRRGLLEADFYGLRDWRAGDSRRWIHWRTSARRGSLVVRQFEQRRSQDLALLVDLWQSADASPREKEHVEQAISFVATLIAEACRQPGRQVILHVAAATALDRAGAATPNFLIEQMNALALIEPHGEDEFPDSLGEALAKVAPSLPTLLVSTREIDWDGLEQVAERRNASLGGRKLRSINVASRELSRFFHA
ncbi:MAG TPA: DUF58 domain-containing protein [Pirellulales bacterium]|nr:DUF58 domain-containing protein [Pirellulales bacterium]